jgi:hypothetical protein
LFTAPGQGKLIGGLMNVTFSADDVEATAKEMKARGVEFVQGNQPTRRQRVPRRLFADKNVAWYTTTVKLDLGAHGLIARVSGPRPQRLVRNGQAS